jgi:ligand-binding sensor domain-containing protein/AraC-like DNA-binding protein
MKNYFLNRVKITLLLVIYCLSGHSLDYNSMNNLTVQDGLAGESVFKIFKDKFGYVWIGTSNGLNYFNGYKLRSFLVSDNNRQLNTVYDIVQTTDGQLFAGTAAGIYQVSAISNKLTKIIPGIHVAVRALASYNNTLYIGSDAGLLIYKNGKSQHIFLNRDHMGEGNVIRDICVDNKHRIWILGSNDLFVYENHRLCKFNVKRQINFIGNLHTLTVTGKKIYIGSDNAGLFAFDISTNKICRYINVGCNVITELSSDNMQLYVSTDGGGAHIISLATNSIVKSFTVNSSPQLQDNSVYCFMHDHSGVNWFGYFRRGLSYTYFHRPLFNVYSFNAFTSEGINVRSFCIHDNQKIIGTRNGLYFIDEGKDIIKYFPPSVLGGSIVTSICFYNKMYYVATYDGGVSVINPTTLQLNRFGNDTALATGSFSKLLVSPNRQLWMAGNQGIFIYDASNKKLTQYSQKNSQLYDCYINNMMFDSQKHCWISTQKGLCLFNSVDNVIRSSGFPSDFFNNVSELNCTQGYGDEIVCYSLSGIYHTNEDMTHYGPISISKKIWNNYVSFIAYDKKLSHYWLGTENGLFRFDREFRSFRHYSDEDNVQSKEYSTGSCLIDNNRNLWIGSLNGLMYANLDKVNKQTDELADIAPDDITIDDKTVNFEESYDLQIKRNISLLWNFFSQKLSFRPIVMDYGNPDGNYYEYRVNSEDKWNVVDDKSMIEYNNFHLGINTIHIRIAGSTHVTTFSVKVYPSIWAMIELLVLIATGFILWRIIRKRQMANSSILAEMNTDEIAINGKYSRIKMDKNESEMIFRHLTEYIEHEKPYLNPNLKLSDLAKPAGCTTIKLSQLLNMYANQNYYDFINKYRLEEFKRRVADSAYSRYTLTALSEQCGFKKSSFYSTFKKEMGITPAEYMHQIGRL